MAFNNSATSPGGGNATMETGEINATAIAAAAAAAAGQAAALQQAHQRLQSHKAVEYYATAIAAVIALFTIFHWSRFLYGRYASKSVKELRIMKAQVSIARYESIHSLLGHFH